MSLSLLAAGFVLQMFATQAFAECSAPNLAEANKLLDAGKTEQSVPLLERDLIEFAGEPACDYPLGIALHKAGQNGQALFAFERVLMSDPENVDARLKAALISIERDDAAYAKILLNPLANRQLSQQQQQEASQIREKIAALSIGPLSIRGYILAGIASDDNITSGPDQSSLVIPGLGAAPTPLGTAAKANDFVGLLEAGVSLRKPIYANTWLTGNGNFRQGFNRSRKDVTEDFVNINLGIIQRKGKEFLGAALLSQEYLINSNAYRNSLGLRLYWTHPLNDRAWLTSYVQELHYDYIRPVDNTKHTVIGATYVSSSADDSRTMQYGLYAGQDKAKDATKPQFSSHILGLGLGGSIALNKNLKFSARAGYESQRHDAPDALYLYTRNDVSRDLGIAADYRMQNDWHVLPQYSYTRNASNIALYDYSRGTLMLQFRREFDNAKN